MESVLENAWASRMRTTASNAYGVSLRSREYRRDTEAARESTIDAVEALMFDSEEWANVPATEISDIAHEVVDRYERDRRETEATRAMIADMEDEGLL